MGCSSYGCTCGYGRSYGSEYWAVIRSIGKKWSNRQYIDSFMSDNGCSNEICQLYSEGENDRPAETRDGRKIIYPKNKEILPGPETSYASVGPKWANVANTPFRFGKRNLMKEEFVLQ